MFAQLGAIELINRLTFQTFSRTGSATFAEHITIEGKPKLQKTGATLDEVSISFLLHDSYCNPTKELERLKQYRNEGEILPLLWGNGIVDKNFVIIEISEQIEEADSKGNVLCYTVSCTLKEFHIGDKKRNEEEKLKKNATATGDKKPVAQKRSNPPPCQKEVTDLISKIDNNSKSINNIIVEQANFTTTESKNKILHNLSAIRLLTESLITKTQTNGNCAKEITGLEYRAQQVYISQSNFNREVSAGNTSRFPAENQILLATVRNLKAVAKPAIQKAITRQ